MARPRSVTDEQLIAATARAISARGDGSWTLGDVAAATGVTAAAIVKRFGSKRGLLVAVATRWIELLPVYDGAEVVDPLVHVTDWVDAWVRDACDPSVALGSLTLLFDEISDPETRALLRRGLDAQARYLADALADACGRGQIRDPLGLQTTNAWIDLLAGAAVRSAIDLTDQPAARAAGCIRTEIERWK